MSEKEFAKMLEAIRDMIAGYTRSYSASEAASDVRALIGELEIMAEALESDADREEAS